MVYHFFDSSLAMKLTQDNGPASTGFILAMSNYSIETTLEQLRILYIVPRPSHIMFATWVNVELKAASIHLWDIYRPQRTAVLQSCCNSRMRYGGSWTLKWVGTDSIDDHLTWWLWSALIQDGMLSQCCFKRYIKTNISTHLKSCVAVATHDFKWVKIIDICLIWEKNQ